MTGSADPGQRDPIVPLVVLFNVIQFLGLFLLAVIVITARLSRSIRRTSAWYNFLLTWMLSCISYLFIVGYQLDTPPSFGVCLFQSMLVYAAPVVTVTAGLSFSIEMWRIVTGATSARHPSTRTEYLLLIMPYIFHLLICVEVLAFGLADKSIVERDTTHMFCHLKARIPSIITAAVVIITIVVALSFYVSTALYLRRHWAAFRNLGRVRALGMRKMLIRYGIFSVLPTLGLVFSFIRISAGLSGIGDDLLTLAVGLLPVGAALIFGTQGDLFDAWKFWGKRTQEKTPLPLSTLAKRQDGSGHGDIIVESAVQFEICSPDSNSVQTS
ncbi:hypothetical protein ONZ45_g9474 [Pleurotus djamor]|nr:hypothetical protein ONZ45_g13101 [Pleurotus djamor]KAJ8508244.1 hypothetical protein ONZ45_g9474 [Pleurotus djamor]